MPKDMAAEETLKQAKDVGIPAPSGQYAVGCVDLMHHLDGDPEGGLLVCLFYPIARPTDAATQRKMETRYPYVKWIPDRMYLEAIVGISTTLKQIRSQLGPLTFAGRRIGTPIPTAIANYIAELIGDFETMSEWRGLLSGLYSCTDGS